MIRRLSPRLTSRDTAGNEIKKAGEGGMRLESRVSGGDGVEERDCHPTFVGSRADTPTNNKRPECEMAVVNGESGEIMPVFN